MGTGAAAASSRVAAAAAAASSRAAQLPPHGAIERTFGSGEEMTRGDLSRTPAPSVEPLHVEEEASPLSVYYTHLLVGLVVASQGRADGWFQEAVASWSRG